MGTGPNALTTWERAKALLGFDDDQEAAVSFLIDSVSSSANRISGRKLKARDYPELQLDGRGRSVLLLSEYPVVEIRHLWVDRRRAFGDETEIPAAEYQVLSEAGMVRLYDHQLPDSPGVVKLDATLGYAEPPEDLELAVLECVGWNQRRLSSGTMGLRTVSAEGQVTSQYEITIPMSALSVFESYRSRRL